MRTEKLHGSLHPDCRFNVNVVEYTPLRGLRDIVREYFYAFPIEPR